MKMRATVIISVYKNVDALRLVLESLREQSVRDFEIIVSEDGECDAIRDFVRGYDWFCPYQHLTQSDEGWRKNRALNRAVLAASAEWLIFLDGDCVAHRRFVEMHLRYAGANRVLLGKRVKLSKALSRKLLDSRLKLSNISCALFWRLLFKSGCEFVDEGIFVPFCLDRTFRSVRHLVGCNMSFSRRSIMSINGFDEEYVRPAVGEDADIHWRLLRAGCEFVSVRNRAVVYHLDHKENWTEQEENLSIMRRNMDADAYICKLGIKQYIE